MKVLAMPPPTISWSTLPTSDCQQFSLVETLEPATIASSGRAGLSSALASASSSAISSGPPQATWREADHAVGGGLRAVRGAEGVHDEDVAQRGVSSAPAPRRPCFSPTFMRQFSSSTTWPGATSTPSSQSRTSGTSRPSSSARRCGDRRQRVGLGSNSPSFGRPRCDVTITAAPAVQRRRGCRHRSADARVFGDVAGRRPAARSGRRG